MKKKETKNIKVMKNKYITKLIVDDKEIDLLKYRFGFTKRVNIHKRPNQTASFRGLEMTVATTGDTFFEEWMLSEKAKPKIELHIYYPYLDEGSCQIMTFYDVYLTHHKTIFSSDNSEPMKEEIKLTCAGIKTPNAEEQYTTSWRKTFDREEGEGTVLAEEPKKFSSYFITDTSNNRIEHYKGNQIIYLNIETKNRIGDYVTLNLEDNDYDFEYEGEVLPNDTLENIKVDNDLIKIKLKVVKPKNKNND